MMFGICGEKTNFSPLILPIFAIFFSTRACIFYNIDIGAMTKRLEEKSSRSIS